MRTTIDIPEAVLRRVKAEAALRGLRLKDVVREALQRYLSEAGRASEPSLPDPITEQRLSDDCVFPLIVGPAGPVMPDLSGDGAQRLLDEEDVSRATDSR